MQCLKTTMWMKIGFFDDGLQLRADNLSQLEILRHLKRFLTENLVSEKKILFSL